MNRRDRLQPLGRVAAHDVAYWLLLAVAFAVFLAMNVLTPFKEDDMGFALVEGEWSRVGSLADVLRSHAAHYMNSNGRLADLVPELFAGWLGKGAFNVCNALVFVNLAHVLSLLSSGRRSITAVAAFLAVVGTCYPVPGETMLWMAGSANYMWAVTLSLLLVCWLQRGHGKPHGWGALVTALLFGFLAGAFNEATSLGFAAGLVLYYLFNRECISSRVIAATAGYLLGIALIVSSPALSHRLSVDLATNMPLPELLASRWHIFAEKMWRFYLPVITVAVAVPAVGMGHARAMIKSPWPWIVLCLTATLFLLGQDHERVYAPMVTVALLLLIMAAQAVLSRLPSWVRLAGVAVLLGLCAFTAARGIRVLGEYKAYNDLAVSQIQAAPAQAILHERQFDGYSRFIKLMNFMSANYFGHEVVYCAYYGKRNVQFVGDSVYCRYHQGRLLYGCDTVGGWTSSASQLVGGILAPAGQDHLLLALRLDTIPHTPQVARYCHEHGRNSLAADELRRRLDYGLVMDYTPQGFYPIEYRGTRYLVLPRPDTTISRIEIPLDLHIPPTILTLYPARRQ